ncbi:MAG: HlyD family efflux transporter periplasmic adaptor subunit [Pseudomonadota bacterium]
MRMLIGLLAAVLLASCGQSERRVPSVEVVPTEFEMSVPARGELIASESMPVALPGGLRMGFNISWMAPEFSEVRKGDVVARFDDTQILQTRRSTAMNVAKSNFDLADVERTGSLEQIRIGHESGRVDGEREITEAFANVDERIMSRNEIIDALSDVDYLNVEAAFLEWQSGTFDQRTRAERNLIRAEQQSEQIKLDKQDTALQMMELRSPADGTFIYASTPWGGKLGKGKRVFPGMPVGQLPLRGKVRARLYVAETDAVGLAEGQTARLRLDASPQNEFDATIISVSAIASPLKRDNPQKFITVEADINEIDPDQMRVGSQLRARIITGAISNSIIVPAQAVYGDETDTHVFVVTNGVTQKRNVTLGQRSPDVIEITDGLARGDRVALVAPDGSG